MENHINFIVSLVEHCADAKIKGIYAINSANIYYGAYIKHLASHTTSNVEFNGLVGGSAKVVFNVKSYIASKLEEISASQSNKNIQISDLATIHTSPEFEIYSDNVLCSHNATIGNIEKDHILYLCSRGITYNQARYLIIKGFIKNIINNLSCNEEDVKAYADILDEMIQYVLAIN